MYNLHFEPDAMAARSLLQLEEAIQDAISDVFSTVQVDGEDRLDESYFIIDLSILELCEIMYVCLLMLYVCTL